MLTSLRFTLRFLIVRLCLSKNIIILRFLIRRPYLSIWDCKVTENNFNFKTASEIFVDFFLDGWLSLLRLPYVRNGMAKMQAFSETAKLPGIFLKKSSSPTDKTAK